MVSFVSCSRRVAALALALASGTVVLTGCANAGDPSVAATVNGKEIPIADVQRRFTSAQANPQVQQQLEGDDGTVATQIQGQVLSQLIRSAVLAQGAEELDIEAADEEVAARREEVVAEVGGQDAFEEIVEQNQLTEADITEQLRDLVLQEEIEAALTADLDVPDAEIAAFYE